MGQTLSSTQRPSVPSPSSSTSTTCPVDHSAFSKQHPPETPSTPPSCPVDHTSLEKRAQSTSSAASCPIDHASISKPSSAGPAQCPIQPDALDPRNHLPTLTQERAPSQSIDLPTDRSTSSIPRDAAGNWEYPSPQQFYNALVRKGWETPEAEVETMVQIHNFLNEKAWEEVHKWEAQVNKCVCPCSASDGLPSLTFFFLVSCRKGTRVCNSCASRGVRASYLRRRDSGYFSAGSYQSVSSESGAGSLGEIHADH
jgi:hypothetical protein